MRVLSTVLLACLLAGPAQAQTSDFVTYESLTVGAVAVGLTSTTYRPTGQPQMGSCSAKLESGPIRYRVDGVDPTSTEGTPVNVGDVLPIVGNSDMASIRFIRTTSTSGTLKVTCWRPMRTVDAQFGTVTVSPAPPNMIRCVVAVSTATNLTAVGGSCVAPGSGLSIYLTDVSFGTSAAAGTAADSFPTLKSGTGGTCGTGTAVIWQALTTANSTVVENLTTPIKLAANSELCWIMSTGGSKTLQVNGYIAP